MSPKIAIIDQNMLAAIGLKSIVQHVMPVMQVDTFSSLAELEVSGPEHFFHYFVSADILTKHLDFFASYRQKTIVLTSSSDVEPPINTFHSICINQPEKDLVRSLLTLEQSAHAHGRNHPTQPKEATGKPLSDREIEVMALIVQGYINKEIADKLNIALTTVVTHRKNIMEKLNIKSVSALTIYAVTRGYVDISKI